MKTISSLDLANVLGGRGGAPLSGDVNQNINTNWGGNQTVIINPPVQQPTTRFDYLRQNPAARFGPPPYVPRPIRRR